LKTIPAPAKRRQSTACWLSLCALTLLLVQGCASGSGGPPPNISILVSPKRGGLVVSQTLSVTANLTGDTGNQGANWSFTSTGPTTGAGFSSPNSTSGNPITFTAPSSVGVVTITATSAADNTKTASATIAVTDLTGILTHHNDNARTGSNTQEHALTSSTVTTSTFGKLFSCSVDAAIYAQPLWVANLSFNGATHNVVYVVTQHDSIYAFDADANPCVTLWSKVGTNSKSLIPASETWVTSGDTTCQDLEPEVGIVSTPVIDPASHTIYLVTKTKDSGGPAFHQRIHALDLTTGSEKFSGPVEIAASFAGTGTGTMGGKWIFDPLIHNQRSALLLESGHVIIAWASHCDNFAYHGWLMSYSASTLNQEAVLNVSPNGTLSGIWMAGSGPASDASGNIYLTTGNGTFDANASGVDFGDSVLKLSPPSAGTFAVASYFAPMDQATLELNDADQGSGGQALLPTTGGKNYLVQAGKSGNIYLMDQALLGGYSTTANNVVQELPGALSGGVWAGPAFWNGTVFYGGSGDGLKAFSFNANNSGLLSQSPTSATATFFQFPGPTPSVSSSGTTNGILWALDNHAYCTNGSSTCGAAVLHAYDATNLATELWNSSMSPGDAAGHAVKFMVPTVANGKVYVGTRGSDTVSGGIGELDVYGLKPN